MSSTSTSMTFVVNDSTMRTPPPGPDSVTHGICQPCVARQDWDESPVLVVSRHRAHLIATLRSLLRGVPEVRVVVDRRHTERRRTPSNVPGWASRRRGAERRKGATLVLN